MKIHTFMSNLLLYFTSLFSVVKLWKFSPSSNMKIDSIRDKKHSENKLSELDIKVVMDRLGLTYELQSNKIVEDSNEEDDDEFGELFDREEPCLEEIKEAFDVLDDNNDGFIDATELQRVLRCLGIKGRLVQVEECRRMIRVADENEDGRIDFDEFLKFMETCFC